MFRSPQKPSARERRHRFSFLCMAGYIVDELWCFCLFFIKNNEPVDAACLHVSSCFTDPTGSLCVSHCWLLSLWPVTWAHRATCKYYLSKLIIKLIYIHEMLAVNHSISICVTPISFPLENKKICLKIPRLVAETQGSVSKFVHRWALTSASFSCRRSSTCIQVY